MAHLCFSRFVNHHTRSTETMDFGKWFANEIFFVKKHEMNCGCNSLQCCAFFDAQIMQLKMATKSDKCESKMNKEIPAEMPQQSKCF